MRWWRRRQQTRGVRVVVEQTARGVRLAKGRVHEGRLELLDVRVQEGPPAQVLTDLGAAGWFEHAQIGLMLGLRQREVAILARPEVPEVDLAEAMRWQVAESLSFPPEDALIDVLTMDENEPVARQQVIVVAAQRPLLNVALAPLLGLREARVVWVDVLDCAQRNLVAALAPTQSVACLTLHDDQLLFTVSRGRELLYTRVFELDADGVAQGTAIERIGTQMQRAIDTLERRSAAAAPTQLLLGPTRSLAAALAAIADLSGLPSKRLDGRVGLHIPAELAAQLEAEPALLPLFGALQRPFDAGEPGA